MKVQGNGRVGNGLKKRELQSEGDERADDVSRKEDEIQVTTDTATTCEGRIVR